MLGRHPGIYFYTELFINSYHVSLCWLVCVMNFLYCSSMIACVSICSVSRCKLDVIAVSLLHSLYHSSIWQFVSQSDGSVDASLIYLLYQCLIIMTIIWNYCSCNQLNDSMQMWSVDHMAASGEGRSIIVINTNNLNQVWSVVCSYVQVDGYKLGRQGTQLIYKRAYKCTLDWLSRYNLVYLLPIVNLVLGVWAVKISVFVVSTHKNTYRVKWLVKHGGGSGFLLETAPHHDQQLSISDYFHQK